MSHLVDEDLRQVVWRHKYFQSALREPPMGGNNL